MLYAGGKLTDVPDVDVYGAHRHGSHNPSSRRTRSSSRTAGKMRSGDCEHGDGDRSGAAVGAFPSFLDVSAGASLPVELTRG